MKLYSTYLESKNNTNSCIFCFPAKGIVLKELGDLVLLADTFPLRKGHMILSSKKHFGCLGELPAESLIAVDDVLQSFRNSSKSYSLYEHGKAGSCHATEKGSYCEHFHLHILLEDNQASSNVSKRVEERFENKQKVESSADIASKYYDFGEYLLVGSHSSMDLFPAVNTDVPSHFLRTLFSAEYGDQDRSDWKKIDDFHLFQENYRYCQKAIESLFKASLIKGEETSDYQKPSFG